MVIAVDALLVDRNILSFMVDVSSSRTGFYIGAYRIV